MKNSVQRFGKFLSAMIMPNIGALIAFGFLAAFFNGSGWIPHEGFATIFSAILVYLIPILIASTGGRLIGGERGSIIGAIAVVGAIMSDPDTTMLMAAMIIGPLSGFCIKKFDQVMEGHMPAGFEMLINNFSVGIIGMLLAMVSYLVIGPLMNLILAVLTAGVNVLVDHNMLPLIAVFIEPAKVLFLNNAINHGIFTPIATAQAAEAGKSIMYMLEANPGPGLGVLLAYMFFCEDKKTKQSAPGAVIIHLLGGIHEIYFPYILMNPLVIIAPIAGNIAAIFWYNLTNAGLDHRVSDDGIEGQHGFGDCRCADRDGSFVRDRICGHTHVQGQEFGGSAGGSGEQKGGGKRHKDGCWGRTGGCQNRRCQEGRVCLRCRNGFLRDGSDEIPEPDQGAAAGSDSDQHVSRHDPCRL